MNTNPNYRSLALFIDGVWVETDGLDTIEVLNPADETVLGHLPCASKALLDQALASAERAYADWPEFHLDKRRSVLNQAAPLLIERADQIAAHITLEQGKPLAQARVEVDRVVGLFRYYADQAMQLQAQELPDMPGNVSQKLVPVPIGVIAAFTAWNFPLVLAGRKLAMAISAGCPVILKAAEETPAASMDLVDALSDAGLPRGYVNLVFGRPAEISEHLINSPVVRKISLTGSIPVGKELARLAAKSVKPASLELGGHSAALVFDDADLEMVTKQLALAKFTNAGQICTCPSRLLVQSNVYDRFIELFEDATKELKVGNGLLPDTTMGPLANIRRMEAIEHFVADAQIKGAKVITGGKRLSGPGYFFEPTILADVSPDSAIMQEEYFGPLAPIVPFETEDEAIRLANGLPYGLAAYVFTISNRRIDRLAQYLEAGGVFVNTVATVSEYSPFCGVKESGYGYEGGQKGLETFIHFKLFNVGTYDGHCR